MTRLRPELAQRKLLLRAHSALLRQQLSVDWQVTVTPFTRVAEQARQGTQWLSAHPALVASVVVALVVWRPSTMLSLASRGVWLWRTWRRVQPVLARSSAPTSGMPPPGI